MKIYFIRHAHAVSRNDFEGDDLYRPLSEKGISRAEKAFSRFSNIFKKPDVIISSQAIRAKKTAEILKKYCDCDLFEEPLINPGADFLDYESVIKTYDDDSDKLIALVGHEPDMTKFISFYIAEGELFLIMKKGSICYVDNKSLMGLIQQKILL
jgi:phosphohistidine phosphatase